MEVARELERVGEDLPGPSLRVQLYGLLVAACRNMGDPADGLQALAAGMQVGGSRTARAELFAQGASLHIERGDATAAREGITLALDLVDGELGRPPASSYSAKKRRQWLIDLKAACLTLRSEIGLRLEDDFAQATEDVLESLSLTSERSTWSVRMAAVTQLSAVLLHFGSLRDVQRALRLIDDAERALARRRVRRSHLHRVLLRWTRALALARLGSVDRAENIMIDVIEHLRQKGHVERLKHAVDALAWIVGERAARPARAAYLRRKYVS